MAILSKIYCPTKAMRINMIFKLDYNRSGRISFKDCIEIENYIFQTKKKRQEYFDRINNLISFLKRTEPKKKPKTKMRKYSRK